jgi:diphthine-ammonia ligase
MKLGVLFSGGKDSTYAALLAKKHGHELSCLLTINSQNESSFMYHTPAIELTKKQADLMGVPLIMKNTEGKKELELFELEDLIKEAVGEFKIGGVVTGAVESVYQASRIQEICNKLKIECFNPLWQKDQWELLDDLLKEDFEILVSGVFAYPFDKSWVGRKIDRNFLKELRKIHEELKINPAGEGGEFESLVVNCPLFEKELDVKLKDVVGEGHSWRGVFG